MLSFLEAYPDKQHDASSAETFHKVVAIVVLRDHCSKHWTPYATDPAHPDTELQGLYASEWHTRPNEVAMTIVEHCHIH